MKTRANRIARCESRHSGAVSRQTNSAGKSKFWCGPLAKSAMLVEARSNQRSGTSGGGEDESFTMYPNRPEPLKVRFKISAFWPTFPAENEALFRIVGQWCRALKTSSGQAPSRKPASATPKFLSESRRNTSLGKTATVAEIGRASC